MGEIFQRYELKYLINAQTREILEQAFETYMRPDEHGESTICNVYYDTPDDRLIRRSLEKPIYKEKLRMRSYGMAAPDSKVFLELKKKYDGIVYKRRISLKESKAEEYLCAKSLHRQTLLPSNSQIGREIDYFCDYYGELIPKVYLCYDRTAYFAKGDPNLRITFDRRIRWRQTGLSLTETPGGRELLEGGQSLMEIKTGTAMPLWLVQLLSREQIRQTSFSKYGRAYQCIRSGINEIKLQNGGNHCA